MCIDPFQTYKFASSKSTETMNQYFVLYLFELNEMFYIENSNYGSGEFAEIKMDRCTLREYIDTDSW